MAEKPACEHFILLLRKGGSKKCQKTETKLGKKTCRGCSRLWAAPQAPPAGLKSHSPAAGRAPGRQPSACSPREWPSRQGSPLPVFLRPVLGDSGLSGSAPQAPLGHLCSTIPASVHLLPHSPHVCPLAENSAGKLSQRLLCSESTCNRWLMSIL